MSDQENQERKATEILLSLEEKVNSLLKIISLYDFNTKLILDKINKISKILEKNPVEVKNKQVVQEFSQNPINISNSPIINTKPSAVVTQEKKTASGKKVPISQRITDDKGRDLFMADVLITDENNNEILKTKTNAVGKWQAHLPVGSYNVLISKIDSSKNKIEVSQNISVSEKDEDLKLNTVIVKRN